MVVKWRLVLHRAIMFVYINQVVQVSRRISYQMTRIYKTQLKKSKQKQSILSFSLWRSKPLNPTQISNNPNLQKLSKTQCSLLLLNLLEIIKWRCYFMRGRKKKIVWFRPCLFQGNQNPGIHFSYFSMFGNHPKTWSKKN
jgi:hypothetical protein